MNLLAEIVNNQSASALCDAGWLTGCWQSSIDCQHVAALGGNIVGNHLCAALGSARACARFARACARDSLMAANQLIS